MALFKPFNSLKNLKSVTKLYRYISVKIDEFVTKNI